MQSVAFVSLVNKPEQFAASQASLRTQAQPFPQWIMVEPNARGWNAAQGLNWGIDQVDAEWVVCVHQDVFYPQGWWPRFLAELQRVPDDTAILGLVGTEKGGRLRGHIIDPNGHCYWPALPHEVLIVDELLLAVRKRTGLRFDPATPGFHCYGADICLQAATRGLRSFAIDAPTLHVSTGVVDAAYERAARWLLDKWGSQYGHVLPTPTMVLQDDAKAGFFLKLKHRWVRRQDRLARNRDCPDPQCERAARAAKGAP